ncbi:MAG: 4a-hydroxytetrahydrobiopterin dehydratase [Rhodospirillales bacterium]|nr:4a-hydroxytetrahydrobiopterin dehydratase [Rhodospirillales bacterium]
MVDDLARKSCVACRGDVPPLADDAAAAYLEQTPAWALARDPMRIQRRFTFGNFREALAFVNRVGELAEAEDHHPEIHFGWGYAFIEIFTHKINGLHENDFVLAAKIDNLGQ